MLNSIIRNALRYRSVVVVISLTMLVFGTFLATQVPIDVFPDLDRPRVVILTEATGLATEEVETLVTQPVEIALMGAQGVEDVRSQTTAGLSVIYVEFGWETEVHKARQTVQERLLTVKDKLPDGIAPKMTPPASIMGQIVIAGAHRQRGPQGGRLADVKNSKFIAELTKANEAPQLTVWTPHERTDHSSWEKLNIRRVAFDEFHPESIPFVNSANSDSQESLGVGFTYKGEKYRAVFRTDRQEQLDLRTTADWTIRQRLLQISGVAEVFVQGGDRKQYQVLVDPGAMLEYGITLQQVEKALKASNINTSGGFAVTGEKEKPIRILGRIGPGPEKVIADLLKIPVRVTDKRPILLEQVARVVEGGEFKRGDGTVDGIPGVIFTIAKQPHVDTRDLTERIVTALEETESALPADILIKSDLFQLRTFIDRGVFNVGEALVIGSVLVVIVLFLFLMNFRTTFITLTAIPLSLVITTLAFRLISYITGTELTINVMTLGGIAVAMGELVDDAIVDVENIFRRLKENNQLEQPRSSLRVVYEASREIRSAIVFGTLVVILVFLPLFALSGMAGRLFTPLAISYIVSILSSLLVSLTVTPVLSYYLLPRSGATQHEKDGPLLAALKWIAGWFIRLSMRFSVLLLLLTWIAVGFSVLVFMNLGGDFLPEFDEGSVQVNVSLPPGSSLKASNDVTKNINERLAQLQKTETNPDGLILHFVQRTGRAEMDEHAMPVNATEYILSINPETNLDREGIIERIRAEVKKEAPGVSVETEQPLQHMISHMVGGSRAKIAIRIYGDEIDDLQRLGNRAESLLKTIEGVADPFVVPIQKMEELHIEFRPDDLAFYGVTREYIANVLQTALQGEVVSEVLDGQRRFDLLVRMNEEYRTDYTNLNKLRIDLPDNRNQIELQDIANVETRYGPNAMYRENARRRIEIRCNTSGRDLVSTVEEIKQALEQGLELPEGYYVEYAGVFVTQQEATQRIMMLSVVAFVGIFLVLMILIPSVPVTLQILNALPTAFIGGVAALAISGQSVTVASLVGFISLGGIAVRNGVLLVTHYVHLMREEGEEFSREMILRGSLERLAPVLMTALTAGIALVPLVLGGNEPGREILYPVATVILGGLITSTFCEFLIHPGLFWSFSGKNTATLLGSRVDELSDKPGRNQEETAEPAKMQ